MASPASRLGSQLRAPQAGQRSASGPGELRLHWLRLRPASWRQMQARRAHLSRHRRLQRHQIGKCLRRLQLPTPHCNSRVPAHTPSDPSHSTDCSRCKEDGPTRLRSGTWADARRASCWERAITPMRFGAGSVRPLMRTFGVSRAARQARPPDSFLSCCGALRARGRSLPGAGARNPRATARQQTKERGRRPRGMARSAPQ